MGVTSIRLNAKDEKILNFLRTYLHCDISTLLKKSLWALYEDIKDKEVIKDFEKKETENKTKFVEIEDLLK